MTARAPLDVDLEDKIVYGLTPMRLAYVAVALVAGFALWSSHWAPEVLRGAVAAAVILGGAVAAWGRLRGRAADEWAWDVVVFLMRNYEVEWRAMPPRARGMIARVEVAVRDRLEQQAELAA